MPYPFIFQILQFYHSQHSLFQKLLNYEPYPTPPHPIPLFSLAQKTTVCHVFFQPVYLRALLASDAGMINCCGDKPELCFRVPDSYRELLPPVLAPWPSCILHSSNLLHAAPLKHDPYTPDSMDSPSPNAIAAHSAESVSQPQPHPLQCFTDEALRPKRHLDRAVSPALLKSKLELIVERNLRDGSGSASNSNSDVEEETWTVRKSRSNSDVSWQRSHLLTRAWLQGKGQQAYHSFSSNPLQTEQQQQQQYDMVIPRIAIINASNLESNASSVQLHDDPMKKPQLPPKSHQASDQYLDTWYSNTRTRSLSEADSSRSPTACTVEEDELPDKLAEQEVVVEDNTKTASMVESKPEASKNTTRSNSIQSQEANVSLKLKAYNKVQERCKRNIVVEKGRCEKCCVVS